jgi:hypothetical protein
VARAFDASLGIWWIDDERLLTARHGPDRTVLLDVQDLGGHVLHTYRLSVPDGSAELVYLRFLRTG